MGLRHITLAIAMVASLARTDEIPVMEGYIVEPVGPGTCLRIGKIGEAEFPLPTNITTPPGDCPPGCTETCGATGRKCCGYAWGYCYCCNPDATCCNPIEQGCCVYDTPKCCNNAVEFEARCCRYEDTCTPNRCCPPGGPFYICNGVECCAPWENCATNGGCCETARFCQIPGTSANYCCPRDQICIHPTEICCPPAWQCGPLCCDIPGGMMCTIEGCCRIADECAGHCCDYGACFDGVCWPFGQLGDWLAENGEDAFERGLRPPLKLREIWEDEDPALTARAKRELMAEEEAAAKAGAGAK